MKFVFTTLLCLMLSAVGMTQSTPVDTTKTFSIETTDGNTYIGRIIAQTPQQITLRTNRLGDLQLDRRDIRKVKELQISQMVDGEYWHESPISSRYFFGANGYGPRKGEGYFTNIWVFYNQVVYGLTDAFSVGVGTSPLFLFNGAPTPIWLTPRLSLPIDKDNVQLGLGGYFGTVLIEDIGLYGMLHGQLTIGSRDRNFNIGLGYGYAGNDWANTPLISFGGIYRTGKKFALMTDNYFLDIGDEDLLLIAIGGRFISNNIAVDAGLVIPGGVDDFLAIPTLGLTVPFGNRK